MSLQERANIAIINKLDQALSHLQSELEDVGFFGIDLTSLKGDFEERAKRKFLEESDPESPPVLELGADESLSPMPLARSYACSFLRQWLDEVTEVIKALEKTEDDKLSQWVQRKLGKKARIDFNRLTVNELDEKPLVVHLLNTAYQVMNYEPARLKNAISKVSDNAQGEAAFIRDLAVVRLGDARVEQVLNDLLAVADPKVIDEVLASPLLKENGNYKVIVFLSELLKKRVALGISDEEWQYIGDDDNDQAA